MTKLVAKSRNPSPELRRLAKLRIAIADKELCALLVSQQENIRYLSGFTGSAGWLMISERKAILATDFRYTEQARTESPNFEVVQIKQELHDWLPGLVSDLGWRRLGFEADFLSYEGYRKLSDAVKMKQANLELVPVAGMVEQLRAIKEPEELVLMARAIELADAALEQAAALVRPGMTEKEAAWEVEKILREGGSEGVPFEIIVASGPNSALPHARPTDRAICSGEPLLIDMGARVAGYCSDLTRTFFLGEPTGTFRDIYRTVLEAQSVAIQGIESGMAGWQADQLARTVIERAGYGDAFGHGLGHGVGLAVHEFPRLGVTSSHSLGDGMVFTVEPGIYLVGQGGVRIEDMVMLENGKVKVLTKAKKAVP